MCVAIKREAAHGWICPSGLVAMAGHIFGGWEPGHMKELLLVLGLGQPGA